MGGFPLGPIKDVIWKKNGNPVSNSFLNFKSEDEGLYTCTIGSATAEINLKVPLRPVKCGVHNRFGLKRHRVGDINYTHANGKPVTSQEGEWPHSCLILKIENGGLELRLVGGASLIAPKVVLTAAHIIRHVLGTNKPLMWHFLIFGGFYMYLFDF